MFQSVQVLILHYESGTSACLFSPLRSICLGFDTKICNNLGAQYRVLVQGKVLLYCDSGPCVKAGRMNFFFSLDTALIHFFFRLLLLCSDSNISIQMCELHCVLAGWILH